MALSLRIQCCVVPADTVLHWTKTTVTFVPCADVRFDQRLQILHHVGISRDKGVSVRTDTPLAASRCGLHRSGTVRHLARSEVFPLLFAPQTYFPGLSHIVSPAGFCTNQIVS